MSGSLSRSLVSGGSLRAPSRTFNAAHALAIMAVVSVGGGCILGQVLPTPPARQSVTAPAATVVLRTMSVYSDKYIGRKMANGKPYDPSKLTVASNDWPLGTRLLLLRHGRSVKVTVTDRMHRRFSGICVDASKAVWNLLTGSAEPGLRKVEVQR